MLGCAVSDGLGGFRKSEMIKRSHALLTFLHHKNTREVQWNIKKKKNADFKKKKN